MAIRKHVTLVANTAQDVTLTGRGVVQVIVHNGTEPVYYRMDGVTAVVAADDTFCCLAGGFRWGQSQDRDGTIVVSCISAGTPIITVELVDREDLDT